MLIITLNKPFLCRFLLFFLFNYEGLKKIMTDIKIAVKKMNLRGYSQSGNTNRLKYCLMYLLNTFIDKVDCGEFVICQKLFWQIIIFFYLPRAKTMLF